MTARITYSRRIGAIAVLLVLGGCGVHAHMDPETGLHGYHTDVASVQLLSTVVGDRDVFLPSTIVVTAGVPQTLSILNTTDRPHGFEILGLRLRTVVPMGKEFPIELPALKGGEVYRISCYMHTLHRGATLVVVPGR